MCNPAIETIFLKSKDQDNEPFDLHVFDNESRLVRQESSVFNNTLFNRLDMKAGKYLLILSNGINKFSTRMVLLYIKSKCRIAKKAIRHFFYELMEYFP